MQIRNSMILVCAALLITTNALAQIDLSKGKMIDNGKLWIPDFVSEIPGLKMGPFVRRADKKIVTVGETDCLVSSDEGKTWKSYPIFQNPQHFKISNERSLFCTKNGVLILAFMNIAEKSGWNWNRKTSDALGAILPTYTVRSLDGGETWEKPIKLHNEWTGANRDMIQTRNGNVVFTSMMLAHNPGRHTVLTYTSRNDGENWERSNIIDLGGIGNHSGVTEPTLEELKDGRLWMLMRTNWGTFWEAFSTDDGISWNHIRPTSIGASSSPGMLKRLESGKLVLVWNLQFPVGKSSYRLRGGDRQWSEVAASNFREELAVAISDDDGKTWSKPKIIAKMMTNQDKDIMESWIAYPYVFEASPGVIWITTMQSNLRIKILEKDIH